MVEKEFRPERVGLWLCLAGAALGALGLLDELVGPGVWTTLFPREVSMRPNTALGLALIGGAGALRCREDAGRLRTILGLSAALVVLVIGLGTLAQYALAIDLHIDHVGRMAPFTAVGLTALAIAVVLFDVRPAARARPSEWFALCAWLVGFTALLGFVFGATVLYRLSRAPLIGVAPPTGVGLLLISTGLLLERPSAGLMRVVTAEGGGGVLLRRLVPVTILGPALLGLATVHGLRALEVETSTVVGAILAASVTVLGLVMLVVTAAPLNRAHEALAFSRLRIESLVELAPDGIFVADLDGRYTDVNRAGCRMMGLTREEIVGKTILDLIPSDRVDQLAHEKEQLLHGEEVVSEWLLRKKDGTWFPVEVSAKILRDGRWQGFVRDISERKRREEELRRTQERLELALRGADLGMWDWNVATGEVVFNARWAEMRGYRPEEVRGHVDSWISGLHPEDWPHVKELLDDYLHGRRAEYESEHRVRTKSGEWIWILDRGKVFARDERGEPLRMAGTELDITSRKHSEQALRLSEAKAAGILSISADAIISVDDEQRITLFNDGAENIFGYAKAEALGAPLDMLLPERFRASHRQHLGRFAAGSTIGRRMGERGAAIYGLRKGGEEFPADAAISRLAVEGTTILTVALRDVTEQKRLEEEQSFLSEMGSVLASTLELQATLTSIGQLATRTLADVCILYLIEEGGEVRRLKAVSRDRAHDWICDVLMRIPRDRSRAHEIGFVLDANRSVLMTQVSPGAIPALAQSEEHLNALRALDPKSIILAPLCAHGKLIGAMALLSSSPTRAYSEADVRFAEQMAQRAADAIDNAQLYDRAQRAIHTRDGVLAIVAHDLRNPLGTILMQAALLRHPGADAERRSTQSAAVIERSGKRMNRIIRDLLDVTRMEEGRLTVEQGRTSADKAILHSVESQKPLAAAASLELELEVARDLPEVWADFDRLLQIFENLIANAMKFTEAGGIIRIGAAPSDGDVLFWVSDTGVGIDSEDLPHVFDRFWQARKRGQIGVGLGLPIVKGLVEAHGGRIWVESTVGQGTTFFFTIPKAPGLEQWSPEPAREPYRH